MARRFRYAGLQNWRESDLPLATKVVTALRNNRLKAKNKTLCCGNYGEPGC